MKMLVAIVAGLSTMASANAQLFSQEGFTGALLGGIAGGIIGHNNGRHSAEGAAIGAGAGLLLGSLVHQSRRHDSYYYQPSYRHYGYGYGYSTAPVYYYQTSVPQNYYPAQAAQQTTEQPQNQQPTAPAPAPVETKPVSNMASANSLFGR